MYGHFVHKMTRFWIWNRVITCTKWLIHVMTRFENSEIASLCVQSDVRHFVHELVRFQFWNRVITCTKWLFLCFDKNVSNAFFAKICSALTENMNRDLHSVHWEKVTKVPFTFMTEFPLKKWPKFRSWTWTERELNGKSSVPTMLWMYHLTGLGE